MEFQNERQKEINGKFLLFCLELNGNSQENVEHKQIMEKLSQKKFKQTPIVFCVGWTCPNSTVLGVYLRARITLFGVWLRLQKSCWTFTRKDNSIFKVHQTRQNEHNSFTHTHPNFIHVYQIILRVLLLLLFMNKKNTFLLQRFRSYLQRISSIWFVGLFRWCVSCCLFVCYLTMSRKSFDTLYFVCVT